MLTYYVDPKRGDDSFDGLSDAAPFATFQHAVLCANDRKERERCEIILLPGQYSDFLVDKARDASS
jgi:hypothetical protein